MAKTTQRAKKRVSQKVTATTPLTPREKLFVAHYCADENGTQAAIKAGYATSGAAVTAVRLLRRANVCAAIEAESEARRARIGADADTLLRRLIAEADADVADLFDDRGALKPVRQWPAIWRRGLVAGVKVTEMFENALDEEGNVARVHVGNMVEVKLADRAKRLEMFGRHRSVKAFKDAVSVNLGSDVRKFLEQVTGDRIMPRQRVADRPARAGDDE